MEHELENLEATSAFGRRLGKLVGGGEVIELVGDIGAGKTALTKGIAVGMAIDEDVQSPTFTLSRLYEAPSGIRLAHYDFYRLQDAGVMSMELDEAAHDATTVTVVEWADIVKGVLPADRLTIRFYSPSEMARHITMTAGGAKSQMLIERLSA